MELPPTSSFEPSTTYCQASCVFSEVDINNASVTEYQQPAALATKNTRMKGLYYPKKFKAFDGWTLLFLLGMALSYVYVLLWFDVVQPDLW